MDTTAAERVIKVSQACELLENSNKDLAAPIKTPWRWKPTSPELLEASEKRILDQLKLQYTGRFVNIGPVVGTEDNEIWTVSMNKKSENLPIVLLHGFGAGIGFWVLNLDALAVERPLYGVDHLGFGRSSRPKFSSDPAKAERQFIDAIEEWRKRMNLDTFVLVGHSFGGYLALSYSITYPNCVAHLVLADPWGLPEKPEKPDDPFKLAWYQKLFLRISQPLNPFWALRASGPKGPGLLERTRPDIIRKFDELNLNGTDVKFGEYMYHCNAQEPSGESAFHSLMNNYRWSKFPLINRIPDLSKDIDITAIYGGVSKTDAIEPDLFPELRPWSYVKVFTLDGAGHHVYADAKEEFNRIILDACAIAEKKLGCQSDSQI